jgi:DNA polymerase III alpha subunit
MKARYHLLSSLTDKEKEMLGDDEGSLVDKLLLLADETTVDLRKKNKVKMPNVNRRQVIRDLVNNYKGDKHIDSVAQILVWEKQCLGTTLSGSIADLNRVMSGAQHNCKQVATGSIHKSAKVGLCVVVEDLREITVKRGATQGRQMAFVSLSDSSYTLEGACVFPDLYDRIKELGISIGDVVSVTGKMSDRGLIINNMRQI